MYGNNSESTCAGNAAINYPLPPMFAQVTLPNV